MTRALRLPDNVHVLDHERPQTVVLDDLGVAIHGQSFAKAATTENLATAYPAAVPGCVNIGLLHTGLTGLEGHERYAPCTLEDLRARGYDYWALGHIHTRGNPCADPSIVFPGNPQGRHIREAGVKGCLLASCTPVGGVETEFQRLDLVRWERGRVDATDLTTEPELLDRVAETLDQLLHDESDTDRLQAVRVIVHGVTSLHDRLHGDTDRYIAEVRNLVQDRGPERLWIEKVEFQTRPARVAVVPEGPIEELQDVLDHLRTDDEALASLSEELNDLRRRLPAELAFDPDAPRLNDLDWLRTALDQVQPLLLDVLLRPITRRPHETAPSEPESRRAVHRTRTRPLGRQSRVAPDSR